MPLSVSDKVVEVIARNLVDTGHTSEKYIDAVEVVKVTPGHDPYNTHTGLCPTCGRLSAFSPQGKRASWGSTPSKCYEMCAKVVEVTYYHDAVMSDLVPGRVVIPEGRSGALYGVDDYDGVKVSLWQS